MENEASLQDQDNDSTQTPPETTTSDDFAKDLSVKFPRQFDVTPEEQLRIDLAETKRIRDEADYARNVAWIDLLRQCGGRYLTATFESYVCDCDAQRKVVASLEAMVSTCATHGVLLFGPSGTGKDHLLIALAREAITAGVESIVWVNGQDLFGAARDLMDSDRSEASFLPKYTQPQVLILSDPVPLSGHLTDFQLNLLYRIVDRRYRACRATWVTMNVSGRNAAEERLGVAIVDRLRHDAQAHFCNWPSYRTTLSEKG